MFHFEKQHWILKQLFSPFQNLTALINQLQRPRTALQSELPSHFPYRLLFQWNRYGLKIKLRDLRYPVFLVSL